MKYESHLQKCLVLVSSDLIQSCPWLTDQTGLTNRQWANENDSSIWSELFSLKTEEMLGTQTSLPIMHFMKLLQAWSLRKI